MSLLWILIIVLLVVVAVGGLPDWGYHSYSYYPSGLVTVLIVVLLILVLTGRL